MLTWMTSLAATFLTMPSQQRLPKDTYKALKKTIDEAAIWIRRPRWSLMP